MISIAGGRRIRTLLVALAAALPVGPALGDSAPPPPSGQCTTGVPDGDLWQQLLGIDGRSPSSQSGSGACSDPGKQREAKSACCASHGGACGCDSATQRVLCCDGKKSKSCSC